MNPADLARQQEQNSPNPGVRLLAFIGLRWYPLIQEADDAGFDVLHPRERHCQQSEGEKEHRLAK